MVLPALAALPPLVKLLLGTAAAGTAVGLGRAATGTQLPTDTSLDEEELERERGAFGSVVDFLAQTSQPVLNTFGGRFGSAGRQTLDLLGQGVDAVLPGDVIPSFVNRSDFTTPTELLTEPFGGRPEDVPAVPRFLLDVAGEVVTSPLSAISFGGAGAATRVGRGVGAASELAEGATSAQLRQRAGAFGRQISDEAADEIDSAAQLAGQQAADRALPLELESQLTRAARDELTGTQRTGFLGRLLGGATGQNVERFTTKNPEGAQKFINDLINRAGGDVDEVGQLISSGGEFGEMFRQGGIRFGNRELVREGTIGRALGQIGEGTIGPERTAKIQEGLGRVGRGLAGATGNLSRLLPTSIRGLVQRGVARGNNTITKQTEEVARILGDVEPRAREQIADIFLNVGKRSEGSPFEVLTDVQPVEAFTTVDDQVDLLMRRTDELIQNQGVALELPADVLEQKFRDMAELNRVQFDQAVQEGIFAPPQVYTNIQNGQQIPQEELLKAFTGTNRVKDREVQRLLERVETKRQQLGKNEAKLAELRRAGGRRGRERELEKARQNILETGASMEDALEAAQAELFETQAFGDFLTAEGFRLTPVDTARMAPPLYLQRVFTLGEETANDLQKLRGRPNFARRRKIRDDEKLADFLNQGDVQIERDPLKIMLNRAQQQGRAVTRAGIVRSIVGDEAVLGQQTEEVVSTTLDNLAKDYPDVAAALRQKTEPLRPRGPILSALNKANRFWKPGVLYGLGIPRVAAFSKNRVGAIFQELTTPGTEVNVSRLVSDLKDTFVTGMNKGLGTKIGRDDLGKALDSLDAAFRAPGGGVESAKAFLRTNVKDSRLARHLSEAMDQGILDGFVDTEQLLRTWARTPGARRWQDFLDMPSAMFQNVEHRMRVGQFLDLRRQGVSPERAGQLVQDAYLDYTVAGVGDRTLRDLVPFVAFITRSIPQQASGLAQRGVLRQSLASVFSPEAGGQGTVLPPFLANQASVDLGIDDAEGNPLVLGGLGIPAETLRFVPATTSPFELGNVARDVVASTQPLVKTGFTFTSGRDPFFDSKPLSFDRTPFVAQALGAPERSEFGRAFQFGRQLGVTAPVEGLLGQAEKIADPRKGPGVKLLNLLTGTSAVSVDEDRAVQQVLEERLARDPRVRSVETLFATSTDPETQRLLEQLQATRTRIRARRASSGE